MLSPLASHDWLLMIGPVLDPLWTLDTWSPTFKFAPPNLGNIKNELLIDKAGDSEHHVPIAVPSPPEFHFPVPIYRYLARPSSLLLCFPPPSNLDFMTPTSSHSKLPILSRVPAMATADAF